MNYKHIPQQAKAVWKLLLSYFKTEWTMDDLPIDIRSQPVSDADPPSRLRLIPWSASVINWPGPSGFGDTRTEALEDLRKELERYKLEKGRLPRPGIHVPMEFVATDRVARHTELSKDFIRRILDIEWAFISDESSLWDFHREEGNEELVEKIHCVYRVDVSGIPTGNLADIFDRIAQAQSRES